MTTSADYTEEEWNELVKAPITAGVLIITSDPHVTSMMGEISAMMNAVLKQPVPVGAEELVGALVRDIKAKTENKEMMEQMDVKGKDPEQVMGEMLAQLKDVCILLDEKSGADEANGFKQWIMGVAKATAEAGREGGFFGIGSVRVSEKEKIAMEEIVKALDLVR